MIEGKLANRVWPVHHKPKCARCKKQTPQPETIVIGNRHKDPEHVFVCQSYLGTEYFIYETTGGECVCYCSEYCAKKHNHRFKNGKK